MKKWRRTIIFCVKETADSAAGTWRYRCCCQTPADNCVSWSIVGKVDVYDLDALQITQETENLMIQQITSQTAQQAPPLPITNQEMNQQEPHTRVDTAKETCFMEGAKKMPADKPNREVGGGFAISSSERYLYVFSSLSLHFLIHLNSLTCTHWLVLI